jgi:HK97 gp10 family phage protein
MNRNEVKFITDGDAISPETLVKRLKALPAEIGSKNGGILRSTLFQVGKPVRDKAKEYAPEATGRLKNAIIMRRDRRPQLAGATENYQVMVRVGRKRDDPKGAWYWAFVHFPTERNPNATPFLTRAFEDTKSLQLQTFRTVFPKKLELAEKKVKKIR